MRSLKDEGGPAFPAHPERDLYSGMSLRDYFAGQALQLFSLTDAEVEKLLAGHWARHDIVAEFCYGVADAMLEARNNDS